MTRTWLLLGCVFGFLSVAGGAFGAHALKTRIPADLLVVWDTGTRYAMLHAVALLATGLIAARVPGPSTTVAGVGFTVGTLVFTGSLWVLALSGQRWLGAITPLGGLSFLAGWVALALAAWRWPTT
ncbi:MAG: DUF423 domain-containing protein [Alphaproteobacteria bacterium]|nr:DUF423 domain-containing protein [Alphaproteobacteria bacterium]